MTSTPTPAIQAAPSTPAARKAPAPRKLWWSGFCALVAAILMALLHHNFWQFMPSQEKTDFYEEVQMLLDLQGAIKERTGSVATMDSIRDVVFGPKLTGAGLKARAEQMLVEKIEDETQKQYAGVIRQGLQRWKESSGETSRERALFLITFVVTGAGVPLAIWWFGFPLVERASQKLAARRQLKTDAERKKREAAMDRARRKTDLRQMATPTTGRGVWTGKSGNSSK